MKKVSAVVAGLAAGCIIISNITLAAGDAAAGEAKSATCAACHGADGNSISPQWPKLAGQHASYLEKQLQNFKSGARNNAIMAAQVANLSDQDMADLAAYYARQKATLGTTDETLLEAGKSLYLGGDLTAGIAACSACHSPQGAGNPAAKYPLLSGQHAQYTATQLEMFRSGERANDPNAIMRSIAKKLSDEQINAVAAILQSLH